MVCHADCYVSVKAEQFVLSCSRGSGIAHIHISPTYRQKNATRWCIYELQLGFAGRVNTTYSKYVSVLTLFPQSTKDSVKARLFDHRRWQPTPSKQAAYHLRSDYPYSMSTFLESALTLILVCRIWHSQGLKSSRSLLRPQINHSTRPNSTQCAISALNFHGWLMIPCSPFCCPTCWTTITKMILAFFLNPSPSRVSMIFSLKCVFTRYQNVLSSAFRSN